MDANIGATPSGDGRAQLRPEYDLDLCPWCGGPADFEHLENGRWSVGCNDGEGECLGFQSMTTWATKREAQAAWNDRAASEMLLVMLDLFENPQFQVAIGGNPIMVDALMERARAAIARATGAAK